MEFVLLPYESRGGDVIDGGFTGIPARTTGWDGDILLLPSNSPEFINWKITTLTCTVHATPFTKTRVSPRLPTRVESKSLGTNPPPRRSPRPEADPT